MSPEQYLSWDGFTRKRLIQGQVESSPWMFPCAHVVLSSVLFSSEHFTHHTCVIAHVFALRSSKGRGVQFLVGFESEFVLLKSTNPVEPASIHHFSGTNSLLADSVTTKTLEEIADGIQAAGIELQMYHGEAAPGQVRLSNYLKYCQRPTSTM